jgi:hypothetical protein
MLLSVPGLVTLIVLGIVAAALAPQLASRAGTPDEIAARIATMRRAGVVLIVAGAALLALRAAGWLH